MTSMEHTELEPDLVRAATDARPRVVIADDDEDLRTYLSEVLREAGYEVFEVEDGAELIGRLSAECLDLPWSATIDAVITDIRMPGASGLTALESIRRYDPRIPIVVMSAFLDERVRREALERGATAVLSKPFGAEELLDTVAAHTSEREW